MFGAIDTAGTGLATSRLWLDAISDNIANVNTSRTPGQEPFRARKLVVAAFDDANGRGVKVSRISLRQGDPALVFDPDNPLADQRGYVLRPDVDLTEEMTNLLLANRTYEANLAVIDRVRDTYKSGLSIGVS